MSVKPWSVILAVGDTAEWKMAGKVTSVVIHTKRRSTRWPFKATKTGKRFVKVGRRLHTGRRRDGYLSEVIVPYTVDLEFTDPDGNTRTASVDPDMVIEV